jgi:hypothetical protein
MVVGALLHLRLKELLKHGIKSSDSHDHPTHSVLRHDEIISKFSLCCGAAHCRRTRGAQLVA